jgi:hypothetical protein
VFVEELDFMIYGIKVVAKSLLGLDRAERNFGIFPDDTMIVSYPRSGNTWTRFLIANLIYPSENITFSNIERLIPDTSSISRRALKRIPRPRFIKTHEYFDHRYPKMVYIVRDPRDVVLSYYDFQRKYRQIRDDYPIENYVKDFVHGRLISADWGTWAENVASWVSTRKRSDRFLLLRFEDMLERTRAELERLARFLGISATPDMLEKAINNSSAERMRELEKQQQDQWVATKKHRKDIPFVRVAKAGGWRKNLPEASVVEIEAAWGDLMDSLGYPLVTGAVRDHQLVSTPTVY